MGRWISLFCALTVLHCQAEVLVNNAQIRLLPPGVPNTSVYFDIENTGDEDVIIVGGSTAVADSVEIHRHIMTEDSMRMERQAELKIKPHSTVTFAPGGLHLMVFSLSKPLVEGQNVSLSLTTQSGQSILFDAKVTKP